MRLLNTIHANRILVRPDDPKFLEEQVESTDLVDFAKLNVRDIRGELIRKSKNYQTTPFDPEGRSLRLFPGSITIWSGAPGAGKTTLVRHLACHLLAKNCGVFVASLEQDWMDVFFGHCQTAAGCWEPNEHQMQWFVDAYWETGKYRLLNTTDFAQYAKLLAIIRVLAGEGIQHAIIDPLMCLDVSSKDIDQQQQFAKAMRQTCRLCGVHLHLVAHPRKPSDANQMLDIWDVAGAKEVVAIADNVIFVSRKKDDNDGGLNSLSDMRIRIRKQRNFHGGNTTIDGYFHRDWRQFVLDQYQEQPHRYLPDNAFAQELAL